jgi:hypothetical protein
VLYNTIRELRPDIPIQAFGGHTHIRDFFVYDDKTTGLESGEPPGSYLYVLGPLTGIEVVIVRPLAGYL